jgi:predicted RNase H-like HicB family nuclease
MLVDGKEYEILIRRQGEEGYSAFCPQLELIVRGTAHVQVEEKMKQLILQHVKGLDGNAGGSNETPQG